MNIANDRYKVITGTGGSGMTMGGIIKAYEQWKQCTFLGIPPYRAPSYKELCDATENRWGKYGL